MSVRERNKSATMADMADALDNAIDLVVEAGAAGLDVGQAIVACRQAAVALRDLQQAMRALSAECAKAGK
jgi:hypothetical protein